MYQNNQNVTNRYIFFCKNNAQKQIKKWRQMIFLAEWPQDNEKMPK